MMFSKKYKYRSIVKKKTNKFYFYFYFFDFLFTSEFFFLIFQKKGNSFDFNIERKIFSKKGFIFKKTSSTFLRHIFKKYKPFFKGFTNLAFDFHFICYPKKKGFHKVKELFEIFNKKENFDKFQILLYFNKGRFYTKYLIEKILVNNIEISRFNNSILFANFKKVLFELKKIHLFFFIKKFILFKNVKV